MLGRDLGRWTEEASDGAADAGLVGLVRLEIMGEENALRSSMCGRSCSPRVRHGHGFYPPDGHRSGGQRRR